MGKDTDYLCDVVGEALARGTAAVLTAQPNDPVEYLGRWLLQYVKNAEVEGQFLEQKRQELEAKKAELTEKQAAAEKLKKAEEERKAAIADLEATAAEPRDLLEKAVGLIKKFTAAGAVYGGYFAEPEEADWTPPEDPEDPAAAESDDEADPADPNAEPEEGEEAEPEPEAEEEEDEGAEPGAPKIPRPIDYSKRYVSYAVASEGQDFICTTEMFRPAPPPEDADEDFKPEPVPFTFRMLDEKMPMVYTPNVAFEQRIKFIKGFPKIGAYQACAVQLPSTGEFKAMVAADTLFPEGLGQPLSQEDQDFMWEVSLALSKAYEAADKKVAESVAAASTSGKESLDALKKKIVGIYHPEGAEAEAEAPAEGEDEAAAEEGEEGEEGEGDGEEDPVAVLKAEVKTVTEELKAAKADERAKTKAFTTSQQVHAALLDVIRSAAPAAVETMRSTTAVPQATFHVLKAVLHVLGKEPSGFSNWKRAYAHFGAPLFDEILAFDATAERDVAAWQRARQAYKGITNAAKLESEFPNTCIGALLLMWLKETRKTARRADAFRKAVAAREALEATLVKKGVELAEAEKLKAEAAEAARLAAEEEERRAAAEAEAEGEGEGEEEED